MRNDSVRKLYVNKWYYDNMGGNFRYFGANLQIPPETTKPDDAQ